MNKITAKAYPKWRRRCLECKYLGLNTPEGILCKEPKEVLGGGRDLRFIPADKSKSFRCKKFVQYKNPLE